jgi:thiamine-phosphate pyrophosphorylase
MSSYRQRLTTSRLYLCTDARQERGDFRQFVEAAYRGGVDVIQLRDKKIDAASELAVLEVLAEASEKHGALWAVNDRADIAALAKSPIIHVGQDDLNATQVRELVMDSTIVGRSSHSLEEAKTESIDPKVDYFAVGPCWPTPTKPGRPAPGLALISQVAELSQTKPWFAIGGIDETNIAQVLSAGASRIVVVRAITDASDPERAAAGLRRFLE